MVVQHCGVLFAYEMQGGWYRYIRAFPNARDANDPEIQKYLKEKK